MRDESYNSYGLVKSTNDGPHQVGFLDLRDVKIHCRSSIGGYLPFDEDVRSWNIAASEVEEVGFLPEGNLAIGVVPVRGDFPRE
jgi:hypothetical protein